MTRNRVLDSPLPIVAAPMAGGPSSPELVRAVAEAGAFPFLAGGNKPADVLSAEIEAVRGLGVGFGVNLFVLNGPSVDRESFRRYAERLQPEAEAYGLQLDPQPKSDDDYLPQKLELLVSEPVPVVSFTFGLPDPGEVAALQRAGSRVLVSVTTPAEAVAASETGADGLVVQGFGAGGHSATHDPFATPEPVETAELVERVRGTVDLPLIGAGGVDGAEALWRILDAGAEAAAVGTLLLRADEAGTSPAHRAALADPAFQETVLTRAFTGRPARALRNGFIDRHQGAAPTGYPEVHHLTGALRQAAAQAGDAQRLHLWAGTGYRKAAAAPAGEIIRRLSQRL